MQRGNLASSFELFQEVGCHPWNIFATQLSMGPVDDVTVQCWHEMAKIYLFGTHPVSKTALTTCRIGLSILLEETGLRKGHGTFQKGSRS